MSDKKVFGNIKKSYTGLKKDKIDEKAMANPCYILMEKYSACMDQYSKKSFRNGAKLKECNEYFDAFNVCMKQSSENLFIDEAAKKKLDVTKVQTGKSPNVDILKEMEEEHKKSQQMFDKKHKSKH